MIKIHKTERYLENNDNVLVLNEQCEVPIIDHNYPLVINEKKKWYFVKNLKIFRLFKTLKLEEVLRVIPVFLLL